MDFCGCGGLLDGDGCGGLTDGLALGIPNTSDGSGDGSGCGDGCGGCGGLLDGDGCGGLLDGDGCGGLPDCCGIWAVARVAMTINAKSTSTRCERRIFVSCWIDAFLRQFSYITSEQSNKSFG